jgi:hypothetical protein
LAQPVRFQCRATTPLTAQSGAAASPLQHQRVTRGIRSSRSGARAPIAKDCCDWTTIPTTRKRARTSRSTNTADRDTVNRSGPSRFARSARAPRP